MSTPTAAWPTRDLYASLGHVGWGVLGDEVPGVRKTLEALVYQLPYGSGAGHVTVSQIASWAHLSPRWVSACLYTLERLGVVLWRRGGVLNGRAQPSYIVISKRALVMILRHTRERWRAALLAKRRREADRVAGLGTIRTPRRKRKPLSTHVELSANLPFPGGGDPGVESPPGQRKDDGPMKQRCKHSSPDVNACGMCSRELRLNPRMDVRTLWEDKTQQPGDNRAGVAAVRAALRQARHGQETL